MKLVFWDDELIKRPSTPPHSGGIHKIIPHPYRAESKESSSEHSNSHSQTPTISPDCQRVGSIVCVVTDTGHGMTSDQIDNLFQEGVQFNANKLQAGGGSGIGLWIAKGVVKLHHGELTAKSEGEGKGSTFKLELPVYLMPNSLYNIEEAMKSEILQELSLAENSPIENFLVSSDSIDSSSIIPATTRSNVTQQDVNISTHSVDSIRANTPPPHNYNTYDRPISISSISHSEERKPIVLVVDDVASSRKIVCRLLKKEGCTCFEAVDGQECLDMIEIHGVRNISDNNNDNNSNNSKEDIDNSNYENYDNFDESEDDNKSGSINSKKTLTPPFDIIFLDYEMPRYYYYFIYLI